MKCIIIEDQAPAQRLLKKYVEDMGTLELMQTFSNAIQALEYLKSHPVDLMFVDIHLPVMSGMDFLKTLTNPPAVILTTAFTEYAVQSYELNVVDYLVKPFSFERFVKAVNKVTIPGADARDGVESAAFFIKSGHEYIKIDPRDIRFIHSDMDYTELHTADKVHLTPETLQHWEQKLDSMGFVRVHKSYLINASELLKVVGNQVTLKGGAEVPIGRAYKEEFMKRYVTE